MLQSAKYDQLVYSRNLWSLLNCVCPHTHTHNDIMSFIYTYTYCGLGHLSAAIQLRDYKTRVKSKAFLLSSSWKMNYNGAKLGSVCARVFHSIRLHCPAKISAKRIGTEIRKCVFWRQRKPLRHAKSTALVCGAKRPRAPRQTSLCLFASGCIVSGGFCHGDAVAIAILFTN